MRVPRAPSSLVVALEILHSDGAAQRCEPEKDCPKGFRVSDGAQERSGMGA